jgi:hypothetical protein
MKNLGCTDKFVLMGLILLMNSRVQANEDRKVCNIKLRAVTVDESDRISSLTSLRTTSVNKNFLVKSLENCIQIAQATSARPGYAEIVVSSEPHHTDYGSRIGVRDIYRYINYVEWSFDKTWKLPFTGESGIVTHYTQSCINPNNDLKLLITDDFYWKGCEVK